MAIKLPVWLTKFRGIKITPFSIQACRYDGFGLSIISIEWQWAGSMCTMSTVNSLFYINVFPHFEEGEVWWASVGILYFMHFTPYKQKNLKAQLKRYSTEELEDEDD